MTMKRSSSTPLKSPVARRKLYSDSSPKSPSSEKCYTGYVVHVGHMCKAATGNEYFDIKFKYGHDMLSVRVMQYDTELDTFKSKKRVPLSIIVKECGNTTFFNKKYKSKMDDILYELDFTDELCTTPLDTDISKISSLIVVEGTIKWMGDPRDTASGHRVRDAILKDKFGNIKLSLWNILCDLEEKKWYIFTDIEIKQYFGTVLATTRTTAVEEKPMDEECVELTEEEVKKYAPDDAGDTYICCPDIISADIKMKMVHCFQVIEATTNAKVAKCPNCMRTINLSKCEKQFKGTLEVEKEKIYTLSFGLKTISDLFIDTDVSNPENFDQLEQKIVLLEDVDIYYNPKMFVTKIVSHEDNFVDNLNTEEAD